MCDGHPSNPEAEGPATMAMSVDCRREKHGRWKFFFAKDQLGIC